MERNVSKYGQQSATCSLARPAIRERERQGRNSSLRLRERAQTPAGRMLSGHLAPLSQIDSNERSTVVTRMSARSVIVVVLIECTRIPGRFQMNGVNGGDRLTTARRRKGDFFGRFSGVRPPTLSTDRKRACLGSCTFSFSASLLARSCRLATNVCSSLSRRSWP